MKKSYLYNKTGWCPKRKERASEFLGDFFGIEKSIRTRNFRFPEFEVFYRSCRIAAEGKFTNKTFFQAVVAMG